MGKFINNIISEVEKTRTDLLKALEQACGVEIRQDDLAHFSADSESENTDSQNNLTFDGQGILGTPSSSRSLTTNEMFKPSPFDQKYNSDFEGNSPMTRKYQNS